MHTEEADDEHECLRSMFNETELSVMETNTASRRYIFHLSMASFGLCVLVVDLPPLYPRAAALLSLTLEKGADTNATLALLKTIAEVQAEAGAPCVYDLILRLRDIAERHEADVKQSSDGKALSTSNDAGEIDIEWTFQGPDNTLVRKTTEPNIATSSNSVTKDSCDFVVALLLIDHMRERVKYMKWISQSCQALGITGHMFGFRRHFFLVLEGEAHAIQRCALCPECLFFVLKSSIRIFYSYSITLYFILVFSSLRSAPIPIFVLRPLHIILYAVPHPTPP
jgi:hypothetical protein